MRLTGLAIHMIMITILELVFTTTALTPVISVLANTANMTLTHGLISIPTMILLATSK